MANIVGLTAMPGASGREQRRLRGATTLDNGERMRAPGLKPVAAPVDIYHRPAQAPIDNNLQSLAEGLSMFNGALQRFSGRQHKHEKEIDKDALSARYMNKSAAEISEALSNGSDPELSNKFSAQFVGNIRAQKQGDEDAQFLKNHYNTSFDKQNGNWDQEVDEYVAKRSTELFAGNAAGANAYMERMAGFKRGMAESIVKDKAEQNDYLRQQNTQDGFASIARQAIDTDASPQQIMASTSEFMRTNKAVMRLPFDKQQEYLLASVDPLLNDMRQSPEKRDKIYAAVDAIFNGGRKGEDGVERRLVDAPGGLGAMAKKKFGEFEKLRNELNDQHLVNETAQYRYNVEAHPEKVDPEQLKAWDKQHPGALKTGELQSLLVSREKALDKAEATQRDYQAERDVEQSRQDVHGKDYTDFKNGDFFLPKDTEVPTKERFLRDDPSLVKKMTADERRQGVIDLFNKDLEFQKNQLVNSGKATKEQAEQWAMGQEIEKYQFAGMVPSAWKEQMQAGANQLTSAAQTATKEMPQGALQAFHLYKTLASKAPNLLGQVADERTRAIYENAMQADGNETEQLRGAIHYYGNHNEQNEKVAREQVTKVVTELEGDPDGWGTWARSWFGREVPENLGQLNDEIRKRATYNVQAYRMPPEQALKKAAQSLKDHYAVVNGWAVPTNDKRLPPAFEKLTEKYIENVVLKAGRNELGPNKATFQYREAGLRKLGIENHRDLTLIPMRGGEFQLFDKRNGHPVLDTLSVDWNGEQRDGRFLTVEMVGDLAASERAEEEERALQVGREVRETREIAAREAAAITKGRKAIGWDKRPLGTPFVQLRPQRTKPAAWLDLSAGRAE